MARASAREITFSGATSLTLGATYTASDDFPVDFGKRATIHSYYTRGTGGGTNKVVVAIETNPYDAATDPTGLYWSQSGIYTDVTGTWTMEPAEYTSGTGTALVQQNVTPIKVDQIDAFRMRLKLKETVAGGSAGAVKVTVVINDPVNSH